MSEDPDKEKVIQGSPNEGGFEDPAEEAVIDESTLMGQLRAMREEAKADKYLDLDIPGYKGLLVARFRPYPVAKSEAKADQLRKQMGRRPILLQMACDSLIAACSEIMVRTAPDKEPAPIDDEVPVTFDSRLADFLGIKNATTARQVVVETFPTEQAILECSVTVSEWLKDTTAEVDEDLLGE